MDTQPSVLIVDDGSSSAALITVWATRLARQRGAQLFKTPGFAKSATALDIANKLEVQWIVSALRFPSDAEFPDVDDDLAALMRRAPCPVWTVQPWAGDCPTSFGVAVVGVDPSIEARAAAYAAADLVRSSDSLSHLVLVHGLEEHPAQLAASQPWPEILASMEIERHGWIMQLANELAKGRLIVEVVVRPIWAPELIGGIARCRNADFTALGSRWRTEGSEIHPSRLVRRVVRATPCPMLVV
jgi:nucleotide-binding universal stress UspA family protein